MLRSSLSATILCLCVAATASGQIGISSAVPPAATPTIQSKRIDSFTSVMQERAILTALSEPCRYVWRKGASVQDIQRDLAHRIPTVINRQALESQGVTVDVTIGDAWPTAEPADETPSPSVTEPRADPFAASEQDPFSEQGKHESKALSSAETETKSPSQESTSVTPWWRQSTSPDDAATDALRQTLAARLTQVLSTADLVIVIRWGQLMITTADDAETHLELRVYDLTPLAANQSPRTRRTQSGGDSAVDMEPIMRAIQNSISPDIWEALGGRSVMTPYYRGNRASLLIATTTATHWQIQALLDHLVEK